MDQQKVATVLTVTIQVLVIAGFVACIVVGPQDQPSPITSPDGETRDTGDRSGSVSPAAYDIVSRQPGIWPVDPLPDVGEIGLSEPDLVPFPVHPSPSIPS